MLAISLFKILYFTTKDINSRKFLSFAAFFIALLILSSAGDETPSPYLYLNGNDGAADAKGARQECQESQRMPAC